MDMTPSFKPLTNAFARALTKSIFLCAATLPVAAWADVRLTTKEWEATPICPGELRAIREQEEMQKGMQPRPFVPHSEADMHCPKGEVDKVDETARRSAAARNAAPPGSRGDAGLGLGYKLYIDDKKYYLQPASFMSKQHAGDVCTPPDYAKAPTYRCVEGQRYRKGCHVFIFDESFEEVGFHTIEIKESALYFCNAVPAVGVGDKTRNEVLMTVQYFFIDGTPAAQISEIGSGWKRMTVALRLKAEGGKVLIEQDDRCLGNPNRIETVPDARRRLARCAR